MPGSETALLASPAPVQPAVAAVAGGRKPAALVRRAVLCGSPGNVGPGREKEEGGREGGKEGGKEGWKEKEDKVGEREMRRGKVREREKGRRREEVRG